MFSGCDNHGSVAVLIHPQLRTLFSALSNTKFSNCKLQSDNQSFSEVEVALKRTVHLVNYSY